MAEDDLPNTAAKGKALTPAAKRALEEAEARRTKASDKPLPSEKGGRDGPEATRYGDWEKDGKISDF